MRFSDAVEGYWLTNKRNRADSTYRTYSRIFSSFEEWVENDELETITAQRANGYLNYLDEIRGVEAQTVLNHWIPLSSFWKWASKELGVPHVIAEGVPRPKVRQKQRTPYTHEEVKLILRGVRYMRAWDPANEQHIEVERRTLVRDLAVVAVLLDTGIRASELCDLQIAHFNRKNGKLIVMHGKGDKQRTLPLGDRSRRRLWQYLTKREECSAADPLFVTKKGDAFDRDYLYRLVSRAGKRYGVSKVGPHRFRHTFAINFLRNGGSPLELQRMLGHEKLETVLIYVRLAEVDIESAQKRASVGDAWNV